MVVRVYQDMKDEWRWNVQAENGRFLANSGEGYINHKDCLDAIELLFADKFEIVEMPKL